MLKPLPEILEKKYSDMEFISGYNKLCEAYESKRLRLEEYCKKENANQKYISVETAFLHSLEKHLSFVLHFITKKVIYVPVAGGSSEAEADPGSKEEKRSTNEWYGKPMTMDEKLNCYFRG